MSVMSDQDIALSKTKLIFISAIALLFVLLGMLLFAIPTPENTIFIKLAAGLCILVFGLIATYAIKKLKDPAPGLSISKEGFHDNSSASSAGFVPWDEVTDIREVIIASQKLISIVVSDPQKYANQGGLIAKLSKRVNIKLSGTSVNISASSLKIQHGDLIKTLLMYYQSSKVVA